MEILELAPTPHTLEAKGISFSVHVGDIGGISTIGLDADEVLRYIEDPNAFLASYYGVTKDQYLSWRGDQFAVRCPAMTTKRRQCLFPVATGVSVHDYLSRQGELCPFHRER